MRILTAALVLTVFLHVPLAGEALARQKDKAPPPVVQPAQPAAAPNTQAADEAAQKAAEALARKKAADEAALKAAEALAQQKDKAPPPVVQPAQPAAAATPQAADEALL